MEERTNVETIDTDDIGEGWYEETPSPQDTDWGDDGTPDDAPQTTEDGYTLKHLGQEYTVTRDEVVALAQKGMDYDRIRQRADALMLGQSETGEHSERRDRELLEFISVYRGVAPEDIPQEVWREVKEGKPLLLAYQSYENKELRARLAADLNRQRSTGSRATLGAPRERGEMESDWYEV